MLKVLLFMSVILVTFIFPMRAARSVSAVRGLRRSALQMAAYVVLYVALVSFFQFG